MFVSTDVTMNDDDMGDSDNEALARHTAIGSMTREDYEEVERCYELLRVIARS